ncbi:class I SAM-dependent DNA methyltransferase [Streptomyces benahoarensis]|uniref:Class I SAM-dependent methyltransferase n=1 Tax=Streptomyces benahoarensis TaxID=2595054 RepID=A0A553ZQX1_9ACTN|nr:class I SAM-dependent methyltransferase [Streptomyces benahoarensis]TSB32802.1 class I SAM-dependent methyltransferase [Streptomyces benahoarensis]TSB43871.1 class I SAM-dependent methyltransferase [Streptomyces benahoarensis]
MMQGQPHRDAGMPEPYAATADLYDRLVAYAIDQWGESPRARMADFIEETWAARGQRVRRVLELCCGTGLMTEQLVRRGYQVTALDRSETMLALAKKRVGGSAALHRIELPAPLPTGADAVVCTAAALNYQPGAEPLGETLRAVAEALPTGATFVFDLETAALLKGHWGNRIWAADQGDVTFLWNFTSEPDTAYCDLRYTQFTRDDAPAGTYTAAREVHRLYAFDHATVRDRAHAAGFARAEVFENYTARPATDTTRYETWVLTRGEG